MRVLLVLGESVLLALVVPVLELEGVDVCELLAVAVALIELERGTLMAEVGIGVAETLRRVAMLRPRKIMAKRFASASPDRHSVDS